MITNATLPNLFNIEGEFFETKPTMLYCDFITLLPKSNKNNKTYTNIIKSKMIWFQCLN